MHAPEIEEARELLNCLELFCGLPTTPLRHVKLTHVGTVLESLRDELDEGQISGARVKRMVLQSDACEDVLDKYVVIADVPITQLLAVKAEFRSIIQKFALFSANVEEEDSDQEEDYDLPDDNSSNAEGDQEEGPADKDIPLPLVVEKFLAYAERQTYKHIDVDLLRAALVDPVLTEAQQVEMVTDSKKTAAFQKHIAASTGLVKASDMGVRVELCSLIRDATVKGKINQNIGKPGGGGSTSATATAATAGAPKKAHPDGIDPLKYNASTGGFIKYCTARNGGTQLVRRSDLPDWGILVQILSDCSDEDRIDALTAVQIPHPIAEQVNDYFKTFFKAHKKQSDKQMQLPNYHGPQTRGGVYDIDSDDDDHTHRTSSTAVGGRKRKEKKGSDSDDSDADYSREDREERFMTTQERTEAYLKGHPEKKDNPKRSKNLDFYRGAKKMQPYDCFIWEFHALPETEATAAATVATATASDTAPSPASDMGRIHSDPMEGIETQGSDEVGTYPPKPRSQQQSAAAAAPAAKPSAATTTTAKKKAPWNTNYARLEYEHSYIQWLFPIQEGAGMSCTSQPLMKHEIKAINQDPALQQRFVTSYEMILDFFGMQLKDKTTGEVGRNPANYEDRYHNLNTSSHNYLRITRILKCLGEVGFEHYKLPFLRFVLDEMFVQEELTNCYTSCRDYWLKTLRNEDEAKEVDQLRRQLEEEHGVPKSSWPTYSGSLGFGGGGFGGADPDGWDWPDERDDPDYDYSALRDPDGYDDDDGYDHMNRNGPYNDHDDPDYDYSALREAELREGGGDGDGDDWERF